MNVPRGRSEYGYAKNSLELTQRWLERCVKRLDSTEPLYGYHQSLFPIVQGCTFRDLREKAAEHAVALDREGYAIGGLAVGEEAEVMYEMIQVVNRILPQDKPRYLMGVGTPENILEAISLGVDMFDCVMHPKREKWYAVYHGGRDQYKEQEVGEGFQSY